MFQCLLVFLIWLVLDFNSEGLHRDRGNAGLSGDFLTAGWFWNLALTLLHKCLTIFHKFSGNILLCMERIVLLSFYASIFVQFEILLILYLKHIFRQYHLVLGMRCFHCFASMHQCFDASMLQCFNASMLRWVCCQRGCAKPCVCNAGLSGTFLAFSSFWNLDSNVLKSLLV